MLSGQESFVAVSLHCLVMMTFALPCCIIRASVLYRLLLGTEPMTDELGFCHLLYVRDL